MAPKVKALIPHMPMADEILPYLQRIDSAAWYSNFGPLYDEMVLRLSEYFGVSSQNLCLIANATIGLQAVAELIEVDTKTLFEVPSFTFAASPCALSSAKRQYKFIDVDRQMRCVPSDQAGVVMEVLPFGDTIRVTDWMSRLQFLIIDAAASFDSLKNFAPSFSPNVDYAVVVSLHATKLLGAGEGGVIISSDKSLINKIKQWQNFGFESSSGSRRISIMKGTNAKMSEYSCAIALASLDRWNKTREHYAEIQEIALGISNSIGFNVHNAMSSGLVNPYWVLLPEDPEVTKRIRDHSQAIGFETRLWWDKGCHAMPAFRQIVQGSLKTTEDLCERYIGLPFHLQLPSTYWEDIEKVLGDSLDG